MIDTLAHTTTSAAALSATSFTFAIEVVLAVIILLIFLRRCRVTAISATAIALTVTITALVMSLVGQTFNLKTLGAMSIGIGLVFFTPIDLERSCQNQSCMGDGMAGDCCRTLRTSPRS